MLCEKCKFNKGYKVKHFPVLLLFEIPVIITNIWNENQMASGAGIGSSDIFLWSWGESGSDPGGSGRSISGEEGVSIISGGESRGSSGLKSSESSTTKAKKWLI